MNGSFNIRTRQGGCGMHRCMPLCSRLACERGVLPARARGRTLSHTCGSVRAVTQAARHRQGPGDGRRSGRR
eukprot:7391940-Prymnesium_polylepis.3